MSHAWADASSIRLVYITPASDRTWGLARDTRRSLIDPGPWAEDDNPALYYYYLLDLEEDWPGAYSREPGEDDDLIWRRGYPLTHLPVRLSELPANHRYAPPPRNPAWIDPPPPVMEPRRYADPTGPIPPGVESPPS